MKTLFHLALSLLIFVSACSEGTNTPNDNSNVYDLGDGYKLYNLIPDFIKYAEDGAAKTSSEKIELWNTSLEQKYKDFFDQVIYRGYTGTERENYKLMIIDDFWSNIVLNRLNSLKTLSPKAVDKILKGRTNFKAIFPDFNPECDYYLTVSFSFYGKAATINNKQALAIGLEYFEDNIQLDFTIAHEQFHLYHFDKGFSPQGGLYRGLWTEGMASRAQSEIFPGTYSYKDILNFSTSRVNEIQNKWNFLISDVQSNIFSSDQDIKRAYLGAEDNNLGIPPGSGYYIGLRLVEELIKKGNSFKEMTSWTSDKVQQVMLEELPNLTAF